MSSCANTQTMPGKCVPGVYILQKSWKTFPIGTSNCTEVDFSFHTQLLYLASHPFYSLLLIFHRMYATSWKHSPKLLGKKKLYVKNIQYYSPSWQQEAVTQQWKPRADLAGWRLWWSWSAGWTWSLALVYLMVDRETRVSVTEWESEMSVREVSGF